jgi:hypothetical protein
MGIDINTRRKSILEKLLVGKLIHRPAWPGKMSEYNYIEIDDRTSSDVTKTDYKWLFGNGYVKQSNYEWGGRTTYMITDAGKRRLEEM